MVGLLEDVRGALTQWFRREGDLVFLLGEPGGSLGGSEYLSLIHGKEAGLPAPVNLLEERALHDVVRNARDNGLIVSAHDCAEGGLAFAVLESCITSPDGAIGADLKLDPAGRLDTLLFGEAPTRIIVSAPAETRARLEQMAGAAEVSIRLLGKVGGDRLTIAVGATPAVELDVVPARNVWRGALATHLQSGR